MALIYWLQRLRYLIVLTAALTLGPVGLAHAATFCVNSPTSCPAGGTSEPSYETAVAAANGTPGSVIALGPGMYVSNGSSRTITQGVAIEGSGVGVSTIVVDNAHGAAGQVGVDIGAGATGGAIADLSIQFGSSTTLLRGIAESPLTGAPFPIINNVSISKAPGATFTSPGTAFGMDLGQAATVNNVNVALSDLPNCNTGTLGIHAAGIGTITISNSTLDACQALSADDAALIQGRRLTLIGSEDALNVRTQLPGTHAITVSSSLLEKVGMPGSAAVDVTTSGTSASAVQNATLDNDTIVNLSTTPVTAGLLTVDNSDTNASSNAAVTIDNVAASGFTSSSSIFESGNEPSSILVKHSDLDQTKVGLSGTFPTQPAHFPQFQSVIFHPDLGFANAAAGDFRPTFASPLRDTGDPAISAATDSTLDLAGKPRRVDPFGATPLSLVDIGAFEYQYSTPSVTIAAPPSGTAGSPLALSASGTDPDPGETPLLVYAWAFSDGQTAAGSTPTITPVNAGTLTATVTATDPAGKTATSSVPIAIASAPVTTPSTPTTGTPPPKVDTIKPTVHASTSSISRKHLLARRVSVKATIVVSERSTLRSTFAATLTRKIPVHKHGKSKTVSTKLTICRKTVNAAAAATEHITCTPSAKSISTLRARSGHSGTKITLSISVTATDPSGNVGAAKSSRVVH